jgi:hypothetical protein
MTSTSGYFSCQGHLQPGPVQSRFLEREAKRGGPVSVVHTDDNLPVHRRRLFPGHHHRARGGEGDVPARRAQQEGREPAGAA